MASSASKLGVGKGVTKLPAVQLHRRELQVIRNIRVLDGEGLFQRLSLHPFTRNRTRGNGRSATKCLELGVHNLAISNFYLSHHVERILSNL